MRLKKPEPRLEDARAKERRDSRMALDMLRSVLPEVREDGLRAVTNDPIYENCESLGMGACGLGAGNGPGMLGRNFIKWFGKSRMKDARGWPRILYHGTVHDFHHFMRGDLGFHFGSTPRQAGKAIRPGSPEKMTLGDPKIRMAPRIIPVYLRLENPLRMRDVGGWSDPITVGRELFSMGIFDKSDMAELGKRYMAEGLEYIRDQLTKRGYDGVAYRNSFEGAGDSYIAFEPQQIKSMYNKGTWDPKSPYYMEGAVPGAAMSRVGGEDAPER